MNLFVDISKQGVEKKPGVPYRIEISPQTYSLLIKKFTWWSRDLQKDVPNENSMDLIEGKIFDIFYIIVEGLIKRELDLKPSEYVIIDEDVSLKSGQEGIIVYIELY